MQPSPGHTPQASFPHRLRLAPTTSLVSKSRRVGGTRGQGARRAAVGEKTAGHTRSGRRAVSLKLQEELSRFLRSVEPLYKCSAGCCGILCPVYGPPHTHLRPSQPARALAAKLVSEAARRPPRAACGFASRSLTRSPPSCEIRVHATHSSCHLNNGVWDTSPGRRPAAAQVRGQGCSHPPVPTLAHSVSKGPEGCRPWRHCCTHLTAETTRTPGPAAPD